MGSRSICARQIGRSAGAVLLSLWFVGCATQGETNAGQDGSSSNDATASPGTGGNTSAGSAGAGTAIPCDVQTVVENRCQDCHGGTPIGGAPMSLVTLQDFQQDYAVRSTPQLQGQTLKMYELARIRVNREMGTTPMPQAGMLDANELSTLSTWLAAGAPAGAACGGANSGSGTTVDNGGVGTGGLDGAAGAGAGAGNDGAAMNGTGSGDDTGTGSGDDTGTGSGDDTGGGNDGSVGSNNRCDADAAYEPLVPRDGETCYGFPTHGPGSMDAPFSIPQQETYNQFYYDVPWGANEVGTRFGADFDNLPVLHHWLAFGSDSAQPHGAVAPQVTGTTIGENANLIGGWAVGGCNVEFPEEMGLKMPAPGKKIMIQWHHYNFTGAVTQDHSIVQMCTVPAGSRPNTGGLTWLGTENFNGPLGMPPGVESKFSGTCLNETNDDITIVAFWPHMHEIGTNMYTEVIRKDGKVETVFDMPFDFNSQIHYDLDPYVVLHPGDKIRAECTFFNSTSGNVAFGQSTKAEMCYQFAFSYPAGALDKPNNLSLIGATNTCWGD